MNWEVYLSYTVSSFLQTIIIIRMKIINVLAVLGGFHRSYSEF